MRSLPALHGFVALSAALAIGGCAASQGSAPAAGAGGEGGRVVASADLKTAAGADAGRATITSADGVLSISVNARGVPAGPHGVHVHTTGKCDAPDFASAGGHWNPAGKMHGLDNPQGQHAGDMPNLTAAADGSGMVSYQLGSGTLEGLLDADGAAVVIHATADDQKTDPSGNSGGRIACGVLRAG